MTPGAEAVVPEVVVVGSHAPGLLIRVKRIPVAGETVLGWGYEEPMDGGKGSNQAIAAGRLGARTAFVGCLGADRLGDAAEDWLRAAGVDTRYVRRSSTTSTGVGFIVLDANGVPAMVSALGANAELTGYDVAAALDGLGGGRVLLTQFEIPIETALEAARLARARGMTVIVNPAPAPEGPISGLEAAHVLVPNETEAKALLGLSLDAPADPKQMAATLHARSGAGAVLVTLGEQGVVAAGAAGIWRVSPPPVTAVDTSGAGDAFCAALAVAVARGQALRAAAEWACAVAALSVTRAGTVPAYPTAAEVATFLAARPAGA